MLLLNQELLDNSFTLRQSTYLVLGHFFLIYYSILIDVLSSISAIFIQYFKPFSVIFTVLRLIRKRTCQESALGNKYLQWHSKTTQMELYFLTFIQIILRYIHVPNSVRAPRWTDYMTAFILI